MDSGMANVLPLEQRNWYIPEADFDNSPSRREQARGVRKHHIASTWRPQTLYDGCWPQISGASFLWDTMPSHDVIVFMGLDAEP